MTEYVKEEKSVLMTIRINQCLQREYSKLAVKTGRSRNELISIALKYALDNLEIREDPFSANKE